MNTRGVVLLLIALALALIAGRRVWLKRRAEAAETWPTTEATVQSSEDFISSTRAGDITVLCFAFSYLVKGEYYSGRFELLPKSDSLGVAPLLSRMKGRKIQVRYDPAKPESYHLPDKEMEGCDVNSI